MTRALHIGLLLMALLGLLGQSTAMALVPAPVTIGSLQVSIGHGLHGQGERACSRKSAVQHDDDAMHGRDGLRAGGLG